MFARHHYLSGELAQYVRCFCRVVGRHAVAFCAMVSLIGRKNHWRISRIVTLPDYQGVGIGMAVAEAVAEMHVEGGKPRERHRQPSFAESPPTGRRSPRMELIGREKNRLATAQTNSFKNYPRLRRPGGRVVEFVGTACGFTHGGLSQFLQ